MVPLLQYRVLKNSSLMYQLFKEYDIRPDMENISVYLENIEYQNKLVSFDMNYSMVE